MSSSALDMYWQAPPIARTFATLTFTLSALVYTGMMPYYLVAWHRQSVFWKLPPQLWRFATCLMITGPQLSILFDTYFLYMYLSQMELGHPRFPRKEDLVWYLIFVSSVIIALNDVFVKIGSSFTSALIVAIAYTVTQDQRGMKAGFLFFTIPAQLVPYCMILINLLFPGGVYTMMVQITGLLAAHLFDFLTRLWPEFGGGRNLLSTPAFMSRLVSTPRVLQREYGTAIRGTQDPATGQSTGTSHGSGPLPDSWRTRGSGRRLGGS